MRNLAKTFMKYTDYSEKRSLREIIRGSLTSLMRLTATNMSSLIFAMFLQTATKSLQDRSRTQSTMTKSKMREFLPYIHFLRGVAILYVISVHARGFVSYWKSSPDVYHLFDS